MVHPSQGPNGIPANPDTSAATLTEAGMKHPTLTKNGNTTSVAASHLAPLDASRMTVTPTTDPRPVPAFDSAETRSQQICTDHMVTARWTATHGWEAPALQPSGPLSIAPTASVLHYATECFEGLKLYRGWDGKLRVFRVQRNCERMRRSATRIALPDFPADELRKMILALCARDGPRWLSKDSRKGEFLYLRPTFIGTDAALGVQRPREALLYVVLVCMPGPTSKAPPGLVESQQPLSALADRGLKLFASDEDAVRAWPGGFGYAKLGANYGPTLVAHEEARSRGYQQVLWLFGKEAYVTEAGVCNFFVVWRSATTGRLELVTPPLEERIILEGVTRASVLDVARERLTKPVDGMEALEVVERRIPMADIVKAYREDRLVEAFACGTAVFMGGVEHIHFRGEDINVPIDGDMGKYGRFIRETLSNIMYGKEDHEWGVVIEEVDA